MSSDMSDDKNIPTDPDACYETVASQEEIYLEQTEEDLRAILIFDDPTPSPSLGWILAEDRVEQKLDCEVMTSMVEANNDPRTTESPNEELGEAAEELITGDSDDPPLSEETVEEMIRATADERKPGTN